MATNTVENYIKQLYLQQRGGEGDKRVQMGQLASAMGVVPGTATSMVKTLADSGLVKYEPRGGVQLTARGEKLALHVLRRHRLVELFLVKVLELDWSEVHVEAEELEHSISDKVLDKIDSLLGHPSVDPHGDPIPSSKGHVSEAPLLSLADCPVNQGLRIARVIDQDAAFLQFVDRCGLTPGTRVRVEERDPNAAAVLVRPAHQSSVTLGIAAAEKIFVETM
jgi:DtxR family transcriptional regulator, Mn-dependent transcriptional regulator